MINSAAFQEGASNNTDAIAGIAHLVFTFFGLKLSRARSALDEGVSPVITSQTTMWNVGSVSTRATVSALSVWLGVWSFASPARDALSLVVPGIFGGMFLLVYSLCRKEYWFSAPFRYLVVASLLYAAGFAATLL